MMDRAGKLMEGVLTMLDKAAKTLLMGGVALSFATVAHAQAPNTQPPPIITYQFGQESSFSPSYDVARKAMAKLFEGTRYGEGEGLNPIIGVGDVDLNSDNIPDMLAVPSETTEEMYLFCKKEIICPHFVINGKDNKILGKIWANRVDRGQEIVNGHWTLIGTFENEPDETIRNKIETYAFDKDKGEYTLVKTNVNPPAPSPAK